MSRLLGWLQRHRLVLGIAALTYLPVIFSSPGDVGADTKTYLYLDPGGVITEARSLWDSDVALGTVTHQNIGYLWPMGPFYWVFETLGSPDWFAQRIWLGSLLFAAAMGVRFLLRVFDWTGPGVGVAMAAYGLSPYLLDYSARISAVLLPWAGLPWMIGLTVLAVRHGGWRHPARFALVVLTVGSVNATSLLLVGLAPVLWLVHVTVVERSVPWRRSLAAALRIGAGSAVVSVWWVAGLVLQGRYSLPVTRYTETYEVVADASTAPEILRGLGYWFFYGNDKFGAWIEPSVEYTQGVWLLFLTFGLVVLALLATTVVRWRHRSYFVALLVLGALIGIGSHPFDDPSFLGGVFKDFTRTDAGLALRSTPRAVPMVVLATSVLLGAVTGALQARVPRSGRAFTALTLAAIVLANPAMWKVRMIEEHLHRDEDLPEYWLDAAAAFDADDDGTRLWEIPGSDFASYRWGNTVDPITPGLIDRGYVARELVPFGSAESADLVTAFDRRLQEGSLEAASVIPIARLMSVGDLVHRADLTYERFRTPRPVPTAAFIESIDGLGP
ncbi:MAG: alpha-(1-_3)-arabinofuranosyltransferase family protein, partial [Myxococcota bacterium]